MPFRMPSQPSVSLPVSRRNSALRLGVGVRLAVTAGVSLCAWALTGWALGWWA